jgi:putative ABC transport system permease protein
VILAARFAARELRAGVRGFRIFLACLALGVAAIAAAGSTAQAFREGLAAQSREILGGDLAMTVRQRRFTLPERRVFESHGRVAWAVACSAMAEAPSGERRLIELRGVGGGYPLAGQVVVRGAPSLQAALADRPGGHGAVVEQALLDRLHLKIGDRFLAGNVPLVATAVLEAEPDRLSRGFALGPRVLTTVKAVEAGGFLDAGLPFGETARIAVKPGTDVDLAVTQIRKETPGSFYRLRTRDDAAAGFKRMIDQLEYFLGFIGLASLVAGGLGVFGAVGAYLEARKPSIATLKALGAEGALVRDVYLIQIAVLAALGVVIGLAAGAVAPLILGQIVKDQLPVPALFAIYPWPLVKAAAFGLASAAAFSLVPLGRARATPPASLFRHDLAGRLKLGGELIGAVAAALALAILALITAPTALTAAIMIAGVAGAFGLLWLIGWGAAVLAGKARVGARGTWRLGLANLAGPGSAARTASPAIGLGVGLLAAVVLIQSSLLREVTDVALRSAPALVFTDVPGDRTAEFDKTVAKAFGVPLTRDNYYRVPFITGRIAKVRGKPVVLSRIRENARWAYDADITFSEIGAEPPAADVVRGQWWPANYHGPPLAAVSMDVARGADLKLGDVLTIMVAGEPVDAKVAVIRRVDIGSFGASFGLVLSPGAAAGADTRHVAIAKADKAQEERVTRALGRDFAEVNVISVREQLEAVGGLFERVALAVRAAAAVAARAGLLVLAGAIAARARARIREAAILKVLGASRGQILSAYVLEYGAVGAIAGIAGVALGYAAAWPVVTKVFEVHWSVDWSGVAALLAGAAVLAGIGGLLAAFQALSKRPAPALRAD